MSIKTYDSLDDVFDTIRKVRKAADRRVRPTQAALQAGDFVIRYDKSSDLVIYTELLDPVTAEREAGAGEAEVAYVREHYAQEHMKHSRFGRHYSVVCPEGELGDLHVASVEVTLSRADFQKVRAAGWPGDIHELPASLIRCGVQIYTAV